MVGSSNRKVARAARTAGGRRRNASAPIGWYTTLVIIVILGVALVAFSRQERLDASNPGSTPPLAAARDSQGNVTRAADNWHEAYGVYICDKYIDPIKSDANPYGFSTQGNGIIYISPFEKKYAGYNATVGLFAKGIDLKLDRDSFQLPGDSKVYKSGEKCGDKNGKMIVKEWTDAKDEKTGKLIQADPTKLRLQNLYALSIAFIPDDKSEADVPLPPSAATLDKVIADEAAAAAAAQQQQQAATDTSVPVDPTATTVVPGASETTVPAAPAQ